ncbi:hypothetical protein [Paracoccus sp. (in: a-proteobacteria)]|uniref:hypothetical protein n=1 Tax=Paracoccus sp. TaxID=267 RepID=UPI003A8878F5
MLALDDLGLDHCEARLWHGWPRHMSLVMAAAASGLEKPKNSVVSQKRQPLVWSDDFILIVFSGYNHLILR